jgi:hypothetical protein
MSGFRFWIFPFVLLLGLACAPAVLTQTAPEGMKVAGEIIKYGKPETTLVSLSIQRKAGDPSWKAEFADGSSEEIVAEDVPGLTILKWKIDKAREKTLTGKPYKLNIRSGEVTYLAIVSFSSAGRDFSGQTLLKVMALLVAGH